MEKKIIYTSLDDTFHSVDEYREFCQNMEIPYSDGDSSAYLEWFEEAAGADRDYFEAVLHKEELDLNPVLITGTLGLWDGKHEILPTVASNWKDAEMRMMKDADGAELEMLDEQTFKLTVRHHDGTNVFTFRFLYEDYRWEDPSDLDLDDPEIYESIPEDEI